MSKFADIALLLGVFALLILLIFRVTGLSVYVVGEDLGFIFNAIGSLSISTALCVKAGHDLSTGDVKGKFISLATFWFFLLLVDLGFQTRYLFNPKEPVILLYLSFLITTPVVYKLIKNLRGKSWFST
jgi:hypothetical protein